MQFQFVGSNGKSILNYGLGRNYNEDQYLVLEQAGARIAIPTGDITGLSDQLVDLDECIAGMVRDLTRPKTSEETFNAS